MFNDSIDFLKIYTVVFLTTLVVKFAMEKPLKCLYNYK